MCLYERTEYNHNVGLHRDLVNRYVCDTFMCVCKMREMFVSDSVIMYWIKLLYIDWYT